MRSVQVVVLLGFIGACSAASGRGVELTNIAWEYGEGTTSEFREPAPWSSSGSVEDGMALGPLIRSADELPDSPIACGQAIDWNLNDVLVVDLTASCCQFEEDGAEADDGELIVSIIKRDSCCGIESYGNFRAIYLLPEGFNGARLDLDVDRVRCGRAGP